MEPLKHISFENRILRHGMFWLTWVIGFTFIKSFGSGLEVYTGWLTYYLVTLPIFVAHTYLVVYWAAGRFLSGVKILVFIVMFLVMMYIFSFAEMFLTHTLLWRIFPSVFVGNLDYQNPMNVLVSGIGNLYIILVFAATKMVRSWYLSDKKGQLIIKKRLYMERADANAGIQPGMLLFSVKLIERLGKERPSDVPDAIASLSDLLNSVMQAHKNMRNRLDVEMKNVRSLLKLYAKLMQKEMPVLKIEQCNTAISTLPAFMVFSPLEIMIRHFLWMPDNSIDIFLRDEDKVSIRWKTGTFEADGPVHGELMEELDMLYPGRYRVQLEEDPQNITLLISEDPGWKVESRTLTVQDHLAVG